MCHGPMRSDPPGQVNEAKPQQGVAAITVSIRLGCKIEKEIYRSRSRGRMTLTQYERWRETLTVPEAGYNRTKLTCPTCHTFFEVKVYSKSRTRLRKLYFASCFFAIAACGIVLGVLAGSEKGFMVYSLAAPFICFAVWHLSNAIRGRFDASDVVCHARGKLHKIFDEQKIIFPKR